jgi:hypothetical protein
VEKLLNNAVCKAPDKNAKKLAKKINEKFFNKKRIIVDSPVYAIEGIGKFSHK